MKNRDAIRQFVTGVYDLQKLRISTGNRVAQQFRQKLGLSSSTPEDEDAEAHSILESVRKSYDLITSGLIESKQRLTNIKAFKGDGIITDEVEYMLVQQYMDLLSREQQMFRLLEKVLAHEPIYTGFLSKVRGCGPAMSGVILCTLDPHKARHASSFWKYAGLDVGPDGSGRSRRETHLVDVPYVTKDGESATRKGITFNPWLKTKLYVLGTSFLRSKSPYADVYANYKHRLESAPKWSEKTKAHRHSAAIRYMIKIFLRDLWVEWRTIEGLPVSEPYHVAKLGMTPHGE